MRKYRIKWKNVSLAFLVLLILIVLLINPIKLYHRGKIMDINYSKYAASTIVSHGLFDKIINHGYSKFIDKNINDSNFDFDTIDISLNITYNEENNNLIVINKLIEKGYNADDINYILTKGDTKSIDSLLNNKYYGDISEYLKFSHAKLKNIDRYIDYKASNVVSYKDCVTYVNLGLDYENYENVIKISDFSYTMLVNKHFMLDSNFIPNDLVNIPTKYGYSDTKVNKTLLDNYIEMYEAMLKETGLKIYASNGYRSYEDQKKVYNPQNNNSFKEGSSEHQTGLAISISSRITDDFSKSSEKKWLDNNAYKYGFIFRFPTNKDDITGFSGMIYQYRYVGKEAAKVINDNDLTLEEYYALYVDVKG